MTSSKRRRRRSSRPSSWCDMEKQQQRRNHRLLWWYFISIASLALLWMLVQLRILSLSTAWYDDDNDQQQQQQQQKRRTTQYVNRPYDPTKPLNILLLYGDDWRHDSLGIASNSMVQTPFLDQLARDGMWFTHACVTTSVCWISRASLHTGQYYRRHGSHDTDHPHWYRHWNETSFPALLRNQAGYYVGHVGKWNWRGWREVIQHQYDYARQYEGYHWYAVPTTTTTSTTTATTDDDTKRTNKKRKQQQQQKQKQKRRKIHTTQRNQRDALEFLRTRPRDRPFLLTVAFFAPHAEDTNPLQYLPQPKSMQLYLNQTIPLPPPLLPPVDTESVVTSSGLVDQQQVLLQDTVSDTTSTASWPPLELPPFFTERNLGRQRWRQRFDTPRHYQTMMKNYYRLITEVDAACQTIVEELQAQGILEQTLIVFTTDNGYFHAEHGLADKWYPHQPSIRVPLIVRDPRMKHLLWRTTTTTTATTSTRQQTTSTTASTTTTSRTTTSSTSASSTTSPTSPTIPRICDAFVLNVDVAPTIVRAANLSIPSRMQGYDLSTLYLADSFSSSSSTPLCGADSIIKEPEISAEKQQQPQQEQQPKQHQWRQEFVYEHPKLMDDPYSIPASEALVRKDWKYVVWPDFGITQLFHLGQDPMELHDVSSHPQHAALLKEMRERHAELKRQLE